MASRNSNHSAAGNGDKPAKAAPTARTTRARRINGGDTARTLTAKGIEGFVVSEAIEGAQQAKVTAALDIV